MSPLLVELELERERKRKLERKLKLSRGLMPVPPSSMRIRSPPSRLSVPSIVAWQTKKQKTNRQTRPPSSAGSRPPFPKFSGYVEVEAHYIFHPSTIWVRPLFTELGPKNPPKSHFAMKQTNICCFGGDINYGDATLSRLLTQTLISLPPHLTIIHLLSYPSAPLLLK